MTTFDIIVLFLLGVTAIVGFSRGLVQELIALSAWFVVVLAIRLFHTPTYEALQPHVENETGAAIAAFLLLMVIPFFIVRFVAKKIGSASRNSVIGAFDRVLGFGFGAVKASLVITLAFSLIVLASDTIWGENDRPLWLTDSNSYPVINAGSEVMVDMIADRHAILQSNPNSTDNDSGATGSSTDSDIPFETI